MDVSSEIMETAMQVVAEQLAVCAEFNQYSVMLEMSLVKYLDETWRKQNYCRNKRYRVYKQLDQFPSKQPIPSHGTGVFIARSGSQDDKSSTSGATISTLSSENSSNDFCDQISFLESSEYEYPQDEQGYMVYNAAESVLLECTQKQ